VTVILGFDTATADTAVGVVGVNGGDAIETLVAPEPGGRPAHASALLPAIEHAVDEAGGWLSIELIAVGVGPGSFTGARIAVTTARALAQARGLPVAPVPTTSALAAGIAELPEASARPRLAVVDARRGEVFVALDSGSGQAGRPRVCSPDEIAEELGAEGTAGALAAGDGSIRFRPAIEAAGIEVLADSHEAHRLSAQRVCLLGGQVPSGGPDSIRPMYLRRPDAERWLERDRRN
jgi:tRNA threonylcarbamoyladenosine biosynthesis protein TsaB